MSNHDQLGEALRQHADRLGDTSPLTLDDVKGRARGIRRRRRAVSGLAAAAVLAVAVPAGIAVSDRASTSPDHDPAASPSVTPSDATPTPGPSPRRPVHAALTVRADSSSYAPEIPYLRDGAVVLKDGSEVPLDGNYTTFAPLGDGWAAIRGDDEGNSVVDLLSPDGTVTDSRPSNVSLGVSLDGSIVSFATPDGDLMTVAPDAAPQRIVAADAMPSATVDPVAVTGSDSCVENAADGGCTVFFDAQDASAQGAYTATAQGEVTELPELLTLGGVSPDGPLSGIVQVADDLTTCSSVLAADLVPLWRTCSYRLGEFSPDGRYVVGRSSYGDGSGDGTVAILDAASGDLLAEWQNSAEHQAFAYDLAWDTDSTLLATVFEEGTWGLMRMTPQGHLTAVITGAGADMDPIAVLPAGR